LGAYLLGIIPLGKRLSGVTVSLTSYGQRLDTVHAAIFSILRGKYIPEQIILVVNEELSDAVKKSLRPFKKWGLRILQSENLGPHTKYFPAIREGLKFNTCLVTADDDIFYRRNWLQGLYDVHRAHPCDVVCWWAKAISFRGQTIGSYHEWPDVSNTNAAAHHFALGVGGVLYPHSMVTALLERGTSFVLTAPKNDDIWLHATAVESNHLIRQITDRFRWPLHIPGTQAVGLKHTNHLPDGNDKTVQLAYSSHALEVIRSAHG